MAVADFEMDMIKSELVENSPASEAAYKAALKVHNAGYEDAFRLIKAGLDAKVQAGMRISVDPWKNGIMHAVDVYAGLLKPKSRYDNDIVVTFKQTEIDIPRNTTKLYVRCAKNAFYANNSEDSFGLFFKELGFKPGEYNFVQRDGEEARFYDVRTTRLLEVLGIDQKQFLASVNSVRNETAANITMPWSIRTFGRPKLAARPMDLSQKLTA